MPLTKQTFPLRLPVDRLERVYVCAADAFTKHDYLYVARFGQDLPELRGCALIMLGNRVGGESVLDKNDVRTARSCLYRAFAAWRSDDLQEASRWIAEGKALGGADAELGRLSALISKACYRVVIHSRGQIFEHLASVRKLPEIDLVLTSFAPISNSALDLPVGASLASMIPPGPPVDLVFIYDPWILPSGPSDAGAPVVYMLHDNELAFEVSKKGISYNDFVAVQSTAEMIECGFALGAQSFVQYHFFPAQIGACRLTKQLTDRTQRNIDLLFTGGMTQDFYRDKRQRIVPLAYELDPCFQIEFYEGILPHISYEHALRSARFVPVSGRSTNYISSRSFDALANGAINLVDEACGVPFMFSQRFACFQDFRCTNVAQDIERHLHRYDEIVEEIKAEEQQLEAELREMVITNEVRARRFVRDFLFVTHVLMPSQKLKQKNDVSPGVPPFNRPNALTYHSHQLDALIELARPQDTGTSAQWLQLAMAQSARIFHKHEEVIDTIDQGLKHHPQSVALSYARGLLLRSSGQYDEADSVFASIAEGHLVSSYDDPFPMSWEPLHGAYWIMDCRIRARSPDMLVPLTSETTIWQSFALSHRADFCLRQIRMDSEQPSVVEGKLRQALAFAKRAIEALPYNDAAQRAYLRAVYGLFHLGQTDYGGDFLQSFKAAHYTDGRIFNDFAAMSVDVLMRTGQLAEAQKVIQKLSLFLKRTHMSRTLFFLYPEVETLLARYNLPHGNLRRL